MMAAPLLQAQIDVDAPVSRVWSLISDFRRMPEWSPQCRACWWDEGAGPEVGAWFTGRNETSERTWETRSRVVASNAHRLLRHTSAATVDWSKQYLQRT